MPAKDGQGQVATTWIQERRNEWYVTLDFSKPEGKDLFLKLVKSCDIWMESSKPGSYTKWGLTDEAVLQANPKLVIAHVLRLRSERASGLSGPGPRTDMIGQAFGGLMYQTGFPDPDPAGAGQPLDGRLYYGPVLPVVVPGRLYFRATHPAEGQRR